MIARSQPERGRIGIFTTDADLVVRSWDAALAGMTGIASAEAVGRPLEEVVPSLAERQLLDLVREPLVSGSPVVLAPALHRYLIPCAPSEPSGDFDRMQQRVVIGALRNDERAAGIVVTIEDVTARLESERNLARQLGDADPARRLEAVKQLEGGDSESAGTLAHAIADEDWQVRRAAVHALGRSQDAALVGAVVDALRDSHRNFSFLSSALQLLTLTGVDLASALIGLLRDPDPDLRIQAALALGTQRSKEGVSALMQALDDPDPNVRFHAIEALGKLSAVAAIDRLTAVATSGDFFLAFAAIDALIRIGDPIVAPHLVPLLADPMLAGAAADALGGFGDEGLVEPLVAALDSESAPVESVVSAIAAIQQRYVRGFGGAPEIEDGVGRALSPRGARRVLEALQRASGGALRDLVLVVGWLRDPDVAPALAQLLGSAEVRHEVIEALVRFGAPAVSLLVAQLHDGAADSRGAAAVALGRIGDRGAVPGLIALLREETRESWLPVIGALAGIGDGRAFLPLLALLGDHDAGVRQAAIGALNSIGHPEMEGHVAALLESPEPRFRESAVKIAGYFGYPSCAAAFLARCRDADESVRCAALAHLPYFDGTPTVDVLAQALRDDTPRARAAAAQALGAVLDPAALAVCGQALADEDAWVRYFAVIAVGRRGDPSPVAELVRLATTDPAPQVRVAAIDALGAVGSADALAALVPLATDADRNAAYAALRVFGRLHWAPATHILIDALRSGDPRRRLVAIEALTLMGELPAVEPLRWTCAADQEPSVAEAAYDGLVALGNAGSPVSRAAVDALVALTADTSQRERAIRSLARLHPSAIPWVAEGFQVDDARTRAAVADALARMLHPAATACLQRALDDEEEIVRRQAISGLARIGTRALTARLSVIATRDRSPLVRKAAAAALARGCGGGV